MKTSRLIISALLLLFVTLLQGQALAEESPVGSWKWVNNDTLVIKPDASVWRDDQKLGDWAWIDKAKNEFYIMWQSKRKDTLKLSTSGSEVSGVNADGEPVSGVRIIAK